MKQSSIYLIIIFIVLGVAVLVLEKPFSEPEVDKLPELGPMYPEFNREVATRMEFGSFGGSIPIIKENEQWYVIDQDKKFPADPDGVEKVFETIEGMIAKELISTNPEKHIQFQVNAPQETETTDSEGNKKPFRMGTLGTEVTITDADNNEIVHLFIGKNGAADFMTTYVRKNQADSVVLVNGYLKAIFGKGSAAGWKDLTICQIEPEEISKIILGKDKDQIEIEAYSSDEEEPKQEKLAWRMVKPYELDIQKSDSDRLARLFQKFRATDYAAELDDPTGYGFEDPSAIVTLNLKDDTQFTLIAGAESEERPNNFYIKKDGAEIVYLVPKYRVETLQRNPSDFEQESTGIKTGPVKKPE